MQRPGFTKSRIETPAYILQVLREQDVDSTLYNWMRDPELLHFLALTPTKLTIAQFRRQLTSLDDPTYFIVGIFTKAPRKLVGVYSVKINPDHRRAVITVVVGDRDHWGKMVPRNTIHYLTAELFHRGDVEKVVANVALVNKRVLANFIGWRSHLETVLKSELVTETGETFDVARFIWLKKAEPGSAGYEHWQQYVA